MDQEPGRSGIMDRLRSETRQLHQETERGAFQRDLLSGRLPLSCYVDLLSQLLPIHRNLERHLRRLAATDARTASIIHERQFQEDNLCEDLRFFDQDPGLAIPLSSSTVFMLEIDALAATRPIALLGVHYVLEGSKNGGRYIAEALRRVYELKNQDGLRYLDPHGEAQPGLWRQFKAAMDTANISGEEQDAIVAAAMATFHGIMRLHQDLFAAADPVT